jgi:phage baseplate assembly protein W
VPFDFFDIRRKGLKFPFIPSETGALQQIEDTYRLTDQNIRHFIVTNEKERVMRPELGLGLRKFLAEPLDDQQAEDIRQYTLEKLEASFPTIRIVSMDVTRNVRDTSDPSRSINFKIRYALVREMTEPTIRELNITLTP